MPRKLPSNASVQAVHDFLKMFIAPSDSDDDILPKNGAYSPFYGFSRIYPQHTSLQDGGTSLDGISRAGVNKVVGRLYQEGMRKPSRNGNPGDLNIPDAHKLARHFLKLRWRNPDVAGDLSILQQAWSEMQPHQVVECVRVLRMLCQWKPGPAGRGGDRGSRRLSSLQGEEGRNVRQKLADASAERSGKAWEEDDDAMSERSTVVVARNAPSNSTAPLQPAAPAVASSSSSSSTGKLDWAAALRTSSSSSSCSHAGGRLSSQELLQQLAKQVHHHAAATPPMTAAQLLTSTNPAPSLAHANLNSVWNGAGPNPLAAASRRTRLPVASSFASTLLSQAPPRPDPKPPSFSPPSRVTSASAAMVQVAGPPRYLPVSGGLQVVGAESGGPGLTLPPLSLLTELPPLSQVLQQAFG